MNVKVHTPGTLKSGSGMKSFKQFLLSLLATTVSIVLTFGTAAIIDNHKKNASKKLMMMTIINDFDNTIELAERVDSLLMECRRLQNEIATHPDFFNELNYGFVARMSMIMDEFPETTERIFSTSIETFNIINDVNFVHEASLFYLERHQYKKVILDELEEKWLDDNITQSLDSLLSFDFPEYTYSNRTYLIDFRAARERIVEMTNLSENEISAFNKKRTQRVWDAKTIAQYDKAWDDFMKYNDALDRAKEKLKEKLKKK